jgi:hypothetical protein
MTFLIKRFCHLILRETSLSLASFDQLLVLSVPTHTTAGMRNCISVGLFCIMSREGLFCYVAGT